MIMVSEEFNKNLDACLTALLKQGFENFEVIAVVSKPFEFHGVRIYSRPELSGNPSAKRNFGVTQARGEILSFLDDDCVPTEDWIIRGVKAITPLRCDVVCGPMVTPPRSTLMERASGYLLESAIVMGEETYRNCVGKRREVMDFPSANFFIRKSDFLKVGGFDKRFWPGEDTKLCLDIINKLNKKIIYDPKVLVYHRRKPLFVKFLQQSARYGRQRGRFVWLFPKTSRKISYFIPSVFLGYLILIMFKINSIFLVPLVLYIFLILLEGVRVILRDGNILTGVVFMVGVFFTHVVYGVNFLRGFIYGFINRRSGLQ